MTDLKSNRQGNVSWPLSEALFKAALQIRRRTRGKCGPIVIRVQNGEPISYHGVETSDLLDGERVFGDDTCAEEPALYKTWKGAQNRLVKMADKASSTVLHRFGLKVQIDADHVQLTLASEVEIAFWVHPDLSPEQTQIKKYKGMLHKVSGGVFR